jgi:hypothetical protein
MTGRGVAVTVFAAMLVASAGWSAEWFVAPDGKGANAGTRESPWELAAALSGGKAVQPGDTIWLREGLYAAPNGTYECRLHGTAEKPIIVRDYRGERATVDGAILLPPGSGNYVWFWGLEVMTSAPRPEQPTLTDDLKRPWGGFNVQGGIGSKYINCIVHDTNQAFSFWIGAVDAEIYGCIIYHNGWLGPDRGHGHAIYTQNDQGTKRLVDNIMFDQFGWGIHAYGSERAYVNGYHIEGNISFCNGNAAGAAYPNILVGGGRPSERIEVVDNVCYHARRGKNVELGYSAPYNVDLVCRGNRIFGGDPALQVKGWRQAEVTGNEVWGPNTLVRVYLPEDRQFEPYRWRGSRYTLSGELNVAAFSYDGKVMDFGEWQAATGFDEGSRSVPLQLLSYMPTAVVVRANAYEPGRAHIAVYSGGAGPVDLSKVLRPGTRYEIRNVQTYWDKPVLSGVADGKPVALTMLGSEMSPEFEAFVVVPVP